MAENTLSNQRLEVLNQMNSVAENVVQNQKNMMMPEGIAAIENRDETRRQLKVLNEKDERLHTGQMKSILHQLQEEENWRTSGLNWYKTENSRGRLWSRQELMQTLN